MVFRSNVWTQLLLPFLLVTEATDGLQPQHCQQSYLIVLYYFIQSRQSFRGYMNTILPQNIVFLKEMIFAQNICSLVPLPINGASKVVFSACCY